MGAFAHIYALTSLAAALTNGAKLVWLTGMTSFPTLNARTLSYLLKTSTVVRYSSSRLVDQVGASRSNVPFNESSRSRLPIPCQFNTQKINTMIGTYMT